ncbi:trypsin-like peptidase domain-containing protein [Streptomyces sp. NPDC101145]|uniref:trypsin-like peptidase domain-containing protein n=1 Tax=Streptomyces sp. NPDC101145 TaxID=3366112 RepID=UPI003811819C
MVADGGISADPSSTTPPWAVRIRWANGEIAGAGVLLSPDAVLTCAHVVPPGSHVTAEFVGAPGPRVPAVTARVDEDAYVPETRDADGDPSGDVALLRLERPRPVHETVTLRRLSAPHRTVRMYGFPHGQSGGVWLRAAIVGGCGRDGQVRLGPRTPGGLAGPGCGGAGVVDDLTGEVIGIVLTNVRDRHGNAFSFMSPAETIVRHLPRVARWTRGPAAVDDRLRSRTDGTPPAPALDEPYAQRLAAWLRGDGDQVKISLVRPSQHARSATLLRAITLADRELRTSASVDRASLDAPGTVPSAGGHDLAVDVTGATAAETAERVAERMGLWRHHTDPADRAVERIRTGGVPLTLVVVGVDQAADPPALLDLLAVLRERGCRLLLVFRDTGPVYARARDVLVDGPGRERRARLVARLRELTGPLAASLGEAMATVRADDPAAVHDALYRAGAALHLLTAADRRAGPASGHGTGPGADPATADPPGRPADVTDLAVYERLADRLGARLHAAAGRLEALRRRRGELLGRLDGYHALHRSLTRGAEDLDADALYRRAHRLLRARPCDVRAAEEAVEAYTALVERADPATARHDAARHDPATARHDAARHDAAGHDAAPHGGPGQVADTAGGGAAACGQEEAGPGRNRRERGGAEPS